MSELLLVSKEDLLLAIECIIVETLKESNKKVCTPTEFISRKDTAEILGITLPTLNVWTKDGIIDSYKAGSSVRYKKDDVYACYKKVDTIKYRS
ncbi:MAG: helix-turn-helix domain-containing protein [Flavobacteriales bacterium]|jgi:excisionase family DNA binding protein|nr:helix-turn-helix domain-containing protein [Flavobacteriales bacterium]